MELHNDFNKDVLTTLLKSSDQAIVTQNELEESEAALIDYARLHAKKVPDFLKTKIMDRLNKLAVQQSTAHTLDLAALPMLDEDANWFDWHTAVDRIHPPETYDNIHLHPLASDARRDLFVVWVKEFVPEEVHHDILESFLILEGSCECLITNAKGEQRKVRLGAGEFITMQTGEWHHIAITSLQAAKAILQWRKLAA